MLNMERGGGEGGSGKNEKKFWAAEAEARPGVPVWTSAGLVGLVSCMGGYLYIVRNGREGEVLVFQWVLRQNKDC